MPAPLAAAGAAAARTAGGRALLELAIALAGVLALLGVVVVLGIVGAFTTLQQSASSAPSGTALADIPPEYLRLYRAAAEEYGIDWAVLAAIGKVETDHGRLDLPGVRSGENFAGAGGPMQFLEPTWEQYGVDGNGDGVRDRYDPADAIPGAANYLAASGAPEDYRAAIYAYNHANWYVEDVLAQADEYRAAARAPAGGLDGGSADVGAALRNSDIVLTPTQRADLRAGGIDPRIVALLDTIGRDHSVVVTSMQSDHAPGTNHEAGRAIDIGSVDGDLCDGSRGNACGKLATELAALEGELHLTELIYCFDPDGGRSPDAFAAADHCDHIHAGYDG